MATALVKTGLTPVPPLEVPHTPTHAPVPVEPVEPVRGYAAPHCTDTAVVLAFFSPVRYRKPTRNALHTLWQLHRSSHPTVLAELTYGKEVPELGPLLPVRWLDVRSDSRLFHKENLWNLAAEYTARKSVGPIKYVFMDSDVEFDNPHWLDDVSALLEQYDIIQPFDKCVWLDDERRPYTTRISCAEAIQKRMPIDLRTQHPGFAWAMTDKAFKAIGGWYDKQVLGAGDTSLILALGHDLPRAAVEPLFEAPSQKAWAKRVADASLSVGYLHGTTLYHKYHGTPERRQYNNRWQYMPPLGADGELLLVRNASGVLEWKDASHGDKVLEYFRSREEDA